MGRFTADVADSEDGLQIEQDIDMFIGRVKVDASVARNSESGAIMAVSVDSPKYSDEQLARMWSSVRTISPKRKTGLISDSSPLRCLPAAFSRHQALVFDGIRYAAEMADIAYWRLFDLLQDMSSMDRTMLTTRQIAAAMLDAWSVVDSVNRLRELLTQAPGVPQDTWHKLFMRRTTDIDELRNHVQHQTGQKNLQSLVASAGQIWGFLSWAEIRNRRYTGDWHMASPGAVYRGDTWIYAGPALPSVPLPFGRIRLHAYGLEVYLGQTIRSVQDAIVDLTEAVRSGSVRPVGPAAVGRNGGDIIYACSYGALIEEGRSVKIMPDVGL